MIFNFLLVKVTLSIKYIHYKIKILHFSLPLTFLQENLVIFVFDFSLASMKNLWAFGLG